jgi:hypothetical protein
LRGERGRRGFPGNARPSLSAEHQTIETFATSWDAGCYLASQAQDSSARSDLLEGINKHVALAGRPLDPFLAIIFSSQNSSFRDTFSNALWSYTQTTTSSTDTKSRKGPTSLAGPPAQPAVEEGCEEDPETTTDISLYLHTGHHRHHSPRLSTAKPQYNDPRYSDILTS